LRNVLSFTPGLRRHETGSAALIGRAVLPFVPAIAIRIDVAPSLVRPPIITLIVVPRQSRECANAEDDGSARDVPFEAAERLDEVTLERLGITGVQPTLPAAA
jgi:hypothetical protein